eukprot:TRINITY_DN41005_c1_g1_i1.p1 TRINITY_DN41005_c1_g1~~TRINITY_DN41005_c1_g1_i1.p1  ORF type:complete len:123 (-),score=8.36 TRINITY_DN41005_c1_g1_i1:52-420(-)
MQSYGLPEQILTRLNRSLFKFIWQRKYSKRKAFGKIKRKTMVGEYNEGGLKMINMLDIQECYYLQWAGRLFESYNESWCCIPKFHFESIAIGRSIFEINCRPNKIKELKRVKNEFWKTGLQL